ARESLATRSPSREDQNNPAQGACLLPLNHCLPLSPRTEFSPRRLPMCRLQGICVALALVADLASAEPKAPRSTIPLPTGARARLGLSAPRHDGTVMAVALSPDGKLLASAGQGETLRVWEAATAREVFRRDKFGAVIDCLTF